MEGPAGRPGAVVCAHVGARLRGGGRVGCLVDGGRAEDGRGGLRAVRGGRDAAGVGGDGNAGDQRAGHCDGEMGTGSSRRAIYPSWILVCAVDVFFMLGSPDPGGPPASVPHNPL